MSFPTYHADAVHRLLDYDGCIAAMRDAMVALSEDRVDQPLRAITPVGDGKLFAVMPGTLPRIGLFGAKTISVFDDPERPGHSAHKGVVVIFSRESGEVICAADAGAITHIRTGCATAVATDALACPDARRLALFGCGAQAESHILAISRVRKLDRITVWGRNEIAACRFAARMARRTRLDVRAERDPATAAQADIVCTVTSAREPVLLREWLNPGTHVNAVGSSYAGPTEVDSPLVAESRYFVDSRRSALAAAAEFLVAKEAGLVGDDHIAGEIGEVLSGRVPGRTGDDGITFYKSLGHIVQDLAATAYVHIHAAVDLARNDS